MKFTEKEWLEDFKEFVQADGVSVPTEVSENILKRVRADLNPSAWMVFVKLLGIHLVVGTLSLAICSQFGLNPFHTSFSLSEYFMKFGHSTCMVLCGVLFIGLTIMLGQLFLRREELLVLSRNAPLQVFGLSVLSMAGFIGFGAEVVLGIGILWFIGAMIGGVATAKMLIWRPSFAS
jgi:hypothetical protein